MKLEQQVTSLELSKKLKSLGVPQESLFKWVSQMSSGTLSPRYFDIAIIPTSQFVPGACEIVCSAFTVAELGEMLKGEQVSHFGSTAYATLAKPQWWITGGKWLPEKQKYDHFESDENKWADALAKMLIHLIEQGIVKHGIVNP